MLRQEQKKSYNINLITNMNKPKNNDNTNIKKNIQFLFFPKIIEFIIIINIFKSIFLINKCNMLESSFANITLRIKGI